MAFPLYEFPDEIILHIFEFVTEKYDLINAALVDWRMNGLAEPHLYSKVQLLDDHQANSVSNALIKRNQRASWIKQLLVSLNFGEHAGLDRLPPLMRLMPQLQDIRLETPDCNHKEPSLRVPWILLQQRYERLFQSSSLLALNQSDRYLHSLQSCVLHFVDSQTELYLLSKYPTLFLHPSLKSLTISCASTDVPKSFLPRVQEGFAHTTPLEYLHLEECDFHPQTLAMILRFPRALKSLKLSEGIRYSNLNDFHERAHGNLSPATLVQALRQQIDSLEFLSLSLGYYRLGHHNINEHDEHLDLRDFRSLKRLDCTFRTISLIRTVPCDHHFWRRLPAQLETLRVFEIPTGITRMPLHGLAALPFPFQTCVMEQKARHGLHCLKKLIFAFAINGNEEEIESDESSGEEQSELVRVKESLRKAAVDSLSSLKKSSGLNLRIDVVGLPRGYIPPYLFKERSPTKRVLWDSLSHKSSTATESKFSSAR